MPRTHVRNPARISAHHFYRQRVACPACGWRLIDVCNPDPIEIINLKDDTINDWEPDLITRCQRCKNDFAIRL